MDAKLTSALFLQAIVENNDAREAGRPIPNPPLGVSIKTAELQHPVSKRILHLDPSHSCLTFEPDLGDDGTGRPDYVHGTWVQFASDNDEAMRDVLHAHHFVEHAGCDIPEETRERWALPSRYGILRGLWLSQ